MVNPPAISVSSWLRNYFFGPKKENHPSIQWINVSNAVPYTDAAHANEVKSITTDLSITIFGESDGTPNFTEVNPTNESFFNLLNRYHQTVKSLPPGKYRVRFSCDGKLPQNLLVQLPANPDYDSDIELEPIYFTIDTRTSIPAPQNDSGNQYENIELN